MTGCPCGIRIQAMSDSEVLKKWLEGHKTDANAKREAEARAKEGELRRREAREAAERTRVAREQAYKDRRTAELMPLLNIMDARGRLLVLKAQIYGGPYGYYLAPPYYEEFPDDKWGHLSMYLCQETKWTTEVRLPSGKAPGTGIGQDAPRWEPGRVIGTRDHREYAFFGISVEDKYRTFRVYHAHHQSRSEMGLILANWSACANPNRSDPKPFMTRPEEIARNSRQAQGALDRLVIQTLEQCNPCFNKVKRH